VGGDELHWSDDEENGMDTAINSHFGTLFSTLLQCCDRQQEQTRRRR
jgi:hypothetical protein